jgi:hypothetical protein
MKLFDMAIALATPPEILAADTLRNTLEDLDAITLALGALITRFPVECELSADLREIDKLAKLSAECVRVRVDQLALAAKKRGTK